MRSSPRGLRPTEEIIDASSPGNELHPAKLPAKLIDMFKDEAFAEDREGFPDFSVVEDVMTAEQVLKVPC
jgi:hypothetical protein